MGKITFWGLTASPFQLKMQSLADYAQLPWQHWPDQADRRQALVMAWRLRRARSSHQVQRFPGFVHGLDEYPEVPYYTLDGRQFYYDSTGLARHLDALEYTPAPLVPQGPAERFLCLLIDEAFDEFGLYMAHHNRWVTSARTNVMAETTSRELRKLLPPFTRRAMQRKLARRQVRRCPYLFSVAPGGYRCAMPDRLTPPARDGFPPTHELLDSAWRRYLQAIESLLSDQPFLLGERFTLADASVYGQLGMNLVDGRAAELLAQLAPGTYTWLHRIERGEHCSNPGAVRLNPALNPLLECIVDTFVDLMRQNASAYRDAVGRGGHRFNEAAFDRGESLYDGSLLGAPFRTVIKTFQVAVWQDLCSEWASLGTDERRGLADQYPCLKDSLFR